MVDQIYKVNDGMKTHVSYHTHNPHGYQLEPSSLLTIRMCRIHLAPLELDGECRPSMCDHVQGWAMGHTPITSSGYYFYSYSHCCIVLVFYIHFDNYYKRKLHGKAASSQTWVFYLHIITPLLLLSAKYLYLER